MGEVDEIGVQQSDWRSGGIRGMRAGAGLTMFDPKFLTDPAGMYAPSPVANSAVAAVTGTSLLAQVAASPLGGLWSTRHPTERISPARRQKSRRLMWLT